MRATFSIHVEGTERGSAWWAESTAVPGLSIAAASLRELRRLIDEAVAEYLDRDTEVVLELVADAPEPESDGRPIQPPDMQEEISMGGSASRLVMVH